jgi:hypothetical protein
MRGCTRAVGAAGSARSPGAVCASTWARKSAGERSAIARAEEGRTVKKKKKKKKHPHHKKTTHAKKHGKKKHGGKKKSGHKRCGLCGHSAAHGKAGCMHIAGGKFCSCKARH